MCFSKFLGLLSFFLGISSLSFAGSFDIGILIDLFRQSRNRPELIRSLKEKHPEIFSEESHILVHHSFSPCRTEADPTHPRIIQFDSISKTVLSYTSPQNGFCANRVEALQCSRGKLGCDSYLLLFSSAPNKNIVLKNSPLCLRCHGVNNAGIFPSREAIWPGFYGELNGKMAAGTPEARDYQTFLRGPALLFPYSSLEGYGDLHGDLQNLPKRVPTVLSTLLGDPKSAKSRHKTPSVPSVPNSHALDRLDQVFSEPNSSQPLSRAPELWKVGKNGGAPIQIRKSFPERVSPEVPKSCILCHVQEPLRSSYIPFDDEVLLTKLLRENNQAFLRSIAMLVEERIHGLRMPPAPHPLLSRYEKDRFLGKLRQVMESN